MSKVNFREKARKHFELAQRHYENHDFDAFPAACLELRMAIECLAYQLLQSYEGEVDAKTLERWQPGKLIDELKEIDDHVDHDVSLSVGIEETDGQPATEMRYIGTENRMSASWAKKSYAALGNFVHERTMAQIRAGDEPRSERVLARFLEIKQEVERVLSANLWAFNLRVNVQVQCNCGFMITRRESILKRDGRIKCAQCGEVLRAQKQGDEWTFFMQRVPVKCPHEGCQHETLVAEKRIQEGEEIECENCHSSIIIQNRLCAVKSSAKQSK